jgi:DNA-binding NarL/FixJ family response regulator
MRGAPEIAAELEERALGLTPTGEAAAAGRRALTAAAHHLHAGGFARARTLLESLIDRAEAPELRSPALRLLGLVRFREESIGEAIGLLRAAAAEAGDRPELRVPVELDLALAAVSASLDHRHALQHADAALALAEQTGDATLLSSALAIKSLTDFLLGRGVDDGRLERALGLEDLDADTPIEFRPTIVAGFLAFFTGDDDRARSLLYPLRARLLERGEDSDLPLLSITLAWLECLSGDLVQAAALAAEGVETATVSDNTTMKAYAHALSALVDAHRGDLESCSSNLADIGGVPEYCLVAQWAASARSLLALSLADNAAAHAALAPLTAFFESYERVDPFLIAFFPDEIEALVALGQLEHAERLTERFAASTDAAARAWAVAAHDRCRAMLLAARADLAAALTAAERSVHAYEQLERPLDLGRSLLVLGRIRRRSKQRAEARVALARALEVFETAGAELWAERARAELDRVGGSGDPDDLTASEERVAELAATGMTNREVAASAFISQKTVEANLSRVYRKLGIRSRAELGLRLAERERAS